MSNKKLLNTVLSPLLSLCLLAGGIPQAQAGVATESTRIIFPQSMTEVSLQLANLNDYPIVMQTWVDNGDLDSSPSTTQAPIIPLPAIFRMAPKEQRSLRLIYSGEKLPDDRESLFWLNLYEIPPKPATPQPPDTTRLTVTLRMQLKVFYRPSKLSVSPEQLAGSLRFSLASSTAGPVLKIRNPTPYFATLGGLSLTAAGKEEALAGDMIDPFSEKEMPLEQIKESVTTKGDKVRFVVINDEGNPVLGETNLE